MIWISFWQVHEEGAQVQDDDVINMQYVMLDTKRKYTRKSTSSTPGGEWILDCLNAHDLATTGHQMGGWPLWAD